MAADKLVAGWVDAECTLWFETCSAGDGDLLGPLRAMRDWIAAGPPG